MIQMQLSQAAHYLQVPYTGEDLEFRGCSTDSRTLEQGALFIALRGENFDGHDYLGQAQESGAVAALVEREPGDSSLPCLMVENTLSAMAQLAAAWRAQYDIPLIAVTGSNGKTTVKEMLAAILSENARVLATQGNFNNEIGVPRTLFNLDERHEMAVIEMGANHPGEIERLTHIAKPTVALITLCAPSHLEGFGSVEGVAKAKAEIYSGLSADGTAVINADDKYADFWKNITSGCRQLTFSLEGRADVTARNTSSDASGCHFTLAVNNEEIEITMNVIGLHNVRNALAAAACCHAIGIPLQQVRSGLARFEAVKGRLQRKQGSKGTCLIDDTYNANPASLEAAMRAAIEISGACWLILGDMGELGDIAAEAHGEAGELARTLGIQRLFTFGELSRGASDRFGEASMHFENIEQLIEAVREQLEEGVTLLVKGSRSMGMERVVNALEEEN